MRFICERCGAAYEAAAESKERLCPDCQRRMAGAPGNIPDWKSPLRDYASSRMGRWKLSEYEQMREMCIRLGDMHGLEMVDSQYRDQYTSAVKTIREGTDPEAVKRAAAVLEQMNGYGDSLAMIQEAHQRVRQLQEDAAAAALAKVRADESRKKKRTRITWGIVAGAVSAVILAVAISVLVIAPRHLRAGDKALAEGAYEEALDQYGKAYRYGAHSQQVEEGQRKARAGLAEQKLAEGDPSGAAELFRILGDSERENDAKAAWAEQMLDAGDFEGALEMYESLDAAEQIDDVYFAWSDSLSAEGDLAAAIEKLSMASDSPERAARLDSLWLQRADQTAESVLAHDAGGDKDPAFAGAAGAELTALSAQLRFCRTLSDAGYDLLEVYPEGVAVEDVVLNGYLPWAFGESDEVDFSRVLLFERTEIPNGDYSYENSMSGLSSPLTDALQDLQDLFGEQDDESLEGQPDPTYNIRLLPGQLFDSGVGVAESWADATCVVLVDGSYVEMGEITHTVTTSGAGGRSIGIPTKTYYPYYAALNNIAVYDKNVPQKGTVYDSSTGVPVCDDDTWFNENKDKTNVVTAAENRFAEFDLAPLYDELEEALLLMYLYY